MDNTIWYCVVIENGCVNLYKDTTFYSRLHALYRYGYTYSCYGDKVYPTYTVLYYGICKHDAEETYMRVAKQGDYNE